MYIELVCKDALIFSSLLSLLSLGLTLTFMTTRVPNFAHGSLATIGMYVTLTFHEIFKLNVYFSLPAAFMVVGLISLLQYMIVLRPLSERGSSTITLMVATIGFALILLAALNIYADYLARTFKISSRYFQLRGADFRLADQPGLLFVAPCVLLATASLLHLALTRTKFGTAMRATIENPDLASVLGINVDLVYKVSWFLAGGLAGLAGGLLPLWLIGNPDTGDYMLISIFAASVVGGLFNIYGGLIGGLLMGFAEVLGTGGLALFVGTWIIPYRPIIPLIAMVITLLVAPRGITGITINRRLKWIRGWRSWFSRLKFSS